MLTIIPEEERSAGIASLSSLFFQTMLTVETLHSLVIEPKKPPVVEHVESSVMTDEQQVCDQATDVMERRSVAVGTEVDETKVTAEGVMIQEEVRSRTLYVPFSRQTGHFKKSN